MRDNDWQTPFTSRLDPSEREAPATRETLARLGEDFARVSAATGFGFDQPWTRKFNRDDFGQVAVIREATRIRYPDDVWICFGTVPVAASRIFWQLWSGTPPEQVRLLRRRRALDAVPELRARGDALTPWTLRDREGLLRSYRRRLLVYGRLPFVTLVSTRLYAQELDAVFRQEAVSDDDQRAEFELRREMLAVFRQAVRWRASRHLLLVAGDALEDPIARLGVRSAEASPRFLEDAREDRPGDSATALFGMAHYHPDGQDRYVSQVRSVLWAAAMKAIEQVPRAAPLRTPEDVVHQPDAVEAVTLRSIDHLDACLARMLAQRARAGATPPTPAPRVSLRFSGSRLLRDDGQELASLTPQQKVLFWALYTRRGETVSYRELLRQVQCANRIWSEDRGSNEPIRKALWEVLQGVRERLKDLTEADGAALFRFETDRGKGFFLRCAPDVEVANDEA